MDQDTSLQHWPIGQGWGELMLALGKDMDSLGLTGPWGKSMAEA